MFQFDKAVIDFGIIVNTNISSIQDDYSINITFMAAAIYNNQVNNTVDWITVGASYYFGNEIWIYQYSIKYIFDTSLAARNPLWVIENLINLLNNRYLHNLA